MDILRRHVFQDHAVDQCRDPFIFRHSGQRDQVGKRLMVLTFPSPNSLLRFKQSRSSRNTLGLKAGAYRKADRLIRAGLVSNKQVCFQRIKVTVDAFHGCIKSFHVDSDKCTHIPSPYFLISFFSDDFIRFGAVQYCLFCQLFKKSDFVSGTFGRSSPFARRH